MNSLTLSVLAHVDAGKTTCAEAMLYKSGAIKSPGRVDHGDAFLDTHFIERQRGITVFAKTAELRPGDLNVQLLDTPGHADLAAEAERVLFAADCALLIVSGPDGVQAHTETLWQLLKSYRLPVFVWVNKMDICQRSREEIVEELREQLGSGFADFSGLDHEDGPDILRIPAELAEALADLSDYATEEYLRTDCLSIETVKRLIAERRAFPCFFGSALKIEGIEELLGGIAALATVPERPAEFGARVFKISRAEQDLRLSWIKVTGGSLKLRDVINGEKVTQIRKYNGRKFEAADELRAGELAAVAGLEKTFAGQGLGTEKDLKAAVLRSLVEYVITFTDGTDPKAAFLKLKRLSDEDPQLRIKWDERSSRIKAEFMGRVQVEVLESVIEDRFGYKTEIKRGATSYRESIAAPAYGVGHFEPLRHYAEVHLLLEPLPAGTGILVESALSTDELDAVWQTQIMSCLMGKEHVGVLTGSPLTDVKMTLVAGRSHLKHTEGGDFREASLRAVRNALMGAENVLLEPFYSFRMGNIPPEQIGRAISDLRGLHVRLESPVQHGKTMSLDGIGPVAALEDYLPEFLSYTRGAGRLSLAAAGYYPCIDPDKVIEEIAYDPERDTDNPAGSVFCSHGSGVNVPWDKVRDYMHLDSGIRISDGGVKAEEGGQRLRSTSDYDENELESIMLREFGPIKRPRYTSPVYNRAEEPKAGKDVRKTYLIVDGYNMIFAWKELRETAETDIAAARDRLSDLLESYSALRGTEVLLVFDAYKVPGGQGSTGKVEGFRVVYTKEGESADAFIERMVREIGRNFNVKIVSSDGMIQLSALKSGTLRMSARELEAEIERMSAEIAEFLDEQRRSNTFSNTPRQV